MTKGAIYHHFNVTPNLLDNPRLLVALGLKKSCRKLEEMLDVKCKKVFIRLVD
ncbi:MAG: hypothetical protein U0K68_04715 [Agathobacter sp.]|nr:hypothetical protein [Agathobacter sp.]